MLKSKSTDTYSDTVSSQATRLLLGTIVEHGYYGVVVARSTSAGYRKGVLLPPLLGRRAGRYCRQYDSRYYRQGRWHYRRAGGRSPHGGTPARSADDPSPPPPYWLATNFIHMFIHVAYSHHKILQCHHIDSLLISEYYPECPCSLVV